MEKEVAGVLKNALTSLPLKKPGGLKLQSIKPVHYAVDMPVSPEIFGRGTLDFIRIDNYLAGVTTTPRCTFKANLAQWMATGKERCSRSLPVPPDDGCCDMRSCPSCRLEAVVPSTVIITVMEVKTGPEDFKPNIDYDDLVGHLNYWVMTKELYKAALEVGRIPPGMGVIVLGSGGFKIKTDAMYRQIPRNIQSYLLRTFGESRKRGDAV